MTPIGQNFPTGMVPNKFHFNLKHFIDPVARTTIGMSRIQAFITLFCINIICDQFKPRKMGVGDFL
jgi:hypothetical protein